MTPGSCFGRPASSDSQKRALLCIVCIESAGAAGIVRKVPAGLLERRTIPFERGVRRITGMHACLKSAAAALQIVHDAAVLGGDVTGIRRQPWNLQIVSG